MEQRAREMGKTSEAAVYRKFINSMKKKTKKLKEQVSYIQFTKKAKESSEKVAKNRERQREINAMAAYKDKKTKGIKFYDKKDRVESKQVKKFTISCYII